MVNPLTIELIEDTITEDVSGRGVIKYLINALHDKYGYVLGDAIELIKSSVSRGSYVLVITGFRPPPTYTQETDGPLGAAALARVLSMGLQAKVLVLIDSFRDSVDAMEVALDSLGVDYIVNCLLSNYLDFNVCIEVLPKNELLLKLITHELINLEPTLAIYVERVGPNYLGVMHSMKGIDVSNYHSSINELHNYLVRNGVPTIGIGDGGNEVGMGIIEDAVRKYVPFGNRCLCPCMGGIACSLRTDVLIASAVSNWGAYALVALLAKYLRRFELVMKPHEEVVGLRNLAISGIIDGVLGTRRPSVDSIPAEVSAEVVNRICKLVK